MGRLTEAAAQAARNAAPASRCATGKLRLELAPGDREELDALLASVGTYTAETIRSALIREAPALGITADDVPSATSFQRHRTRKCRCEPQ